MSDPHALLGETLRSLKHNVPAHSRVREIGYMVNIIDTQITDAEYTEISHGKQ